MLYIMLENALLLKQLHMFELTVASTGWYMIVFSNWILVSLMIMIPTFLLKISNFYGIL